MAATELRKRVVTGLFGVFLLFSLLIWGGVPGAFLIAIVLSLGMIAEFVNITFTLPDKNTKRTLLLGVSLLICGLYFFFPRQALALVVMVFMGLFAYFLFSARRYQGATFLTHCQELMYSIFGLVYLCLLPLFLPAIRKGPHGLGWALLALVIIWAGDTGAYFTGRQWGRIKLYEKISPKKTVEGAAGGLLSGVLVAAAFQRFYLNDISLLKILFSAVVVGVVSQVGDLCESLLKRAFDKKDSGSILPGHGGFLDRFDSVVFGLPIMYACIRYL